MSLEQDKIQEGLVNDLNKSEQENESMVDWWDRAHKNDHSFWLTGSQGPEQWQYLEINNLLKPGTKVLNIGVGLGYCTKALFERGCIVSALDISPTALEKVKDIAITYLPEEITDMPSNYFDVVISHLVAQHMSDEDLLHQFKGVFNAMRNHGIFAIQFSSLTDDSIREQLQSGQKSGSCARTREQFISVVKEAKGRIVNIWNGPVFEQYNECWLFAHIQPIERSNEGIDSLVHFKELSLLLHKLSNEYENQLKQSLASQTTQQLEVAIQKLNEAAQRMDLLSDKMDALEKLKKSRSFRGIIIRIIRFAYRCVRKVLTLLGLKKIITRSRFYRNLSNRGLVEKLSRRRG